VIYSDTRMSRSTAAPSRLQPAHFRALKTPLASVSLAMLLAGCAVPVAAGLEEGDANRVVVALDQQGIDAAKEADPTVEGHFRVLVPRDDASRALATMADEQLPRVKSHGLLDAVDRGQLVPSQAAEHAQLIAGLSGELERTLSGVEGVLAARVHLNVPPRDGLSLGPPPKTTASVLVEHRGSTPPLAVESVQRLVAGGAPGLLPADVVVVFIAHPARASSARSEVGHVGPIAVARGSMTTLKIALAGLVLAILALAAATLALYAKVGRIKREHEAEKLAAARTGGPGAGAGGRVGPG